MMFKSFVICSTRPSSASSVHQLVRHASNYHLSSAVCIERLPLIAPKLNIIEESMKSYLEKWEISKSLLSDHEMRHLDDLKRAQKMASGDVDEKDLELATRLTAQDFVDASLKELSEFKFAPPPDEKVEKDFKSSSRCLDRRLLLVTKIKWGDQYKWLFPAVINQPEESLRQTAERAIETYFPNSKMKLKFLGNAPSAVNSYNYPKKIVANMDGKIGMRFFFFKAQVLSGDIDSASLQNDLIQDYMWLNRDEAKSLFLKEHQRRYWNSFSRSQLFETMDERDVKLVLRRFREMSEQNTQENPVKVSV